MGCWAPWLKTTCRVDTPSQVWVRSVQKIRLKNMQYSGVVWKFSGTCCDLSKFGWATHPPKFIHLKLTSERSLGVPPTYFGVWAQRVNFSFCVGQVCFPQNFRRKWPLPNYKHMCFFPLGLGPGFLEHAYLFCYGGGGWLIKASLPRRSRRWIHFSNREVEENL